MNRQDADSCHEQRIWSVYLVRCRDGTYYCGVTNDIDRRLRQHNGELAGGARYTRSRRPVTLVLACPCPTRGLAQSLEARVKKVPSQAKVAYLSSFLRISS